MSRSDSEKVNSYSKSNPLQCTLMTTPESWSSLILLYFCIFTLSPVNITPHKLVFLFLITFGVECDVTQPDVCLVELLPGPCRGNYSRWYYDQTSGSCRSFTYGGCKGNGNNFLTDNECMQQCVRGRLKGNPDGFWVLLCLAFYTFS